MCRWPSAYPAQQRIKILNSQTFNRKAVKGVWLIELYAVPLSFSFSFSTLIALQRPWLWL